jgi:hypothetical protein
MGSFPRVNSGARGASAVPRAGAETSGADDRARKKIRARPGAGRNNVQPGTSNHMADAIHIYGKAT